MHFFYVMQHVKGFFINLNLQIAYSTLLWVDTFTKVSKVIGVHEEVGDWYKMITHYVGTINL